MPNDPKYQAMLRELERAAAAEIFTLFLIGAVCTLISVWLLYIAIRYGIRDGMRDAQRTDRRSAPVTKRHVIEGPDLRAD